MKQWRKIQLWLRFGILLPAFYISAIVQRKRPFERRFAALQKWCRIVVKLSGAKVEVVVGDGIVGTQGALIVGNHQGSMDPFLLVATSVVPTTAVSKVENLKIPLIGTWLKTLEAITFQRESIKDSVRMMKETSLILQKPRNIVIFPEGTRSKSNEMGEFKAGALKAAYMAKADIMIVVLVNSFTILDALDEKRKPIYVVYDQVIPYTEYQHLSTVELAEKVQSRMKEVIKQYA